MANEKNTRRTRILFLTMKMMMKVVMMVVMMIVMMMVMMIVIMMMVSTCWARIVFSSPPQGAIAASSPSLITTCRENLIFWIEMMVLLFSPPTYSFKDGDNGWGCGCCCYSPTQWVLSGRPEDCPNPHSCSRFCSCGGFCWHAWWKSKLGIKRYLENIKVFQIRTVQFMSEGCCKVCLERQPAPWVHQQRGRSSSQRRERPLRVHKV